MSKERLKEARLMAEMLRVETRLPHNFPFDLVDWLVEQAERVQELEEEVERYQSGRNVAVITKMKMDASQERNERLEKRVQELEKENKRLEDFIETIQNVHFVELQREKAENRRYREALEEIARGRFPGASYKARQALEGESE